jgi:DNA helicase-2/ATP-dependent DNA helicase PcrA
LVAFSRLPPSPSDRPPDPEQAEAARALRGGVLVLAPVGSGKTRVLADRVVEAVRDGFDPRRILCVTFTNRAADEMRSRVAATVGPATPSASVSTFHALCARVLRREHRRLGLPPDFVVFDEDDTLDLLGQAGATKHGVPTDVLQDDLQSAKSPLDVDAPDPRLGLSATAEALFADVPQPRRGILRRYQRVLADRQAVDFGDLVRLVRALFREDVEAAEAWASRYDLVQVDEVQDVHHGEYEVVRHLARRGGNLALIGDVDQTIYGWRGSDPDGVLSLFRRDFAPVRELALRWNHRATRRLVRAANAVLDGAGAPRTRVEPSPALEEGPPVVRHDAPDAGSEAEWVAERLHRTVEEDGLAWGRVGVLCRTNARARLLGEALERRGVPHVTVERFEFFRRQEVKDAMALLRLVARSDDAAAADRVLRRPARGLGDATIAETRFRGAPAGLRVADLLSDEALRAGDPFGPLLAALGAGSIVALDVETTGLDPARDEVVEVGAVRLDAGVETASFHALVRPTVPLGVSGSVHGLSEERLAREGRPAADVFADLAAFVGPLPIAGHNARFDTAILEAHARRAGVALSLPPPSDTLGIARRLWDLPRYDLAACASHAGVPAPEAHRALADARVAAGLLVRLGEALRAGAFERQALLARVPEPVRALAAALEGLRAAAATERPAVVLSRALEASGLRAHYAGEPARARNLAELVRVLEARDRADAAPAEALRDAVLFAALAKNVSLEVVDDQRVPVVTVHQAKGLEFDVVFLAGAVDGEFPHWKSRDDGGDRLEEERRLFYVGVTRARRRLFVSTHAQGDRGRRCRPSPYLRALDADPVPGALARR